MDRNWMQRLYLWACERLYHELAGIYDVVSWLVSLGQWATWRRFALDEIEVEPVLEIGFGSGALLREMAAQGNRICGLELSPAMHAVTSRKLALSQLDVPRVRGSALAMPFASASFGTLIATFPAPYIFAPETLRECVRVLYPGGRLVVVGLWVAPRHDLVARSLPVFYSKPRAAAMAALEDRLQSAGLAPRWLLRTAGWVDLPVLVATRAETNGQ